VNHHYIVVREKMRPEDWSMRLQRATPHAMRSVPYRAWSNMGEQERADLVEKFAMQVLASELAEREMER
jgi:hypothetical protein